MRVCVYVLFGIHIFDNIFVRYSQSLLTICTSVQSFSPAIHSAYETAMITLDCDHLQPPKNPFLFRWKGIIIWFVFHLSVTQPNRRSLINAVWILANERLVWTRGSGCGYGGGSISDDSCLFYRRGGSCEAQKQMIGCCRGRFIRTPLVQGWSCQCWDAG